MLTFLILLIGLEFLAHELLLALPTVKLEIYNHKYMIDSFISSRADFERITNCLINSFSTLCARYGRISSTLPLLKYEEIRMCGL